MEGETKHVKQKLEVFGILKEAVSIYVNNINFIIFAFLTSLPFLCVMFYFETLFQRTLVDTPQIINRLLLPLYHRMYEGFHYWGVYEFDDTDTTVFSQDYLPNLIQLGFIYLVPLHFLQLCSAVVTIYSASKLRSQDNKMSLKDMFQNTTDISIMKGTFITSLYMLCLSTGFLVGFAGTLSNCYSFYVIFSWYIFFAAVACVVLVKLLIMYLEWSAIWNMSIVISVLDGIYGFEALRVSCFFNSGKSGNQKRGLLLMLVFFVLGLCLRFSCIYLGCYKGGNGIFVQIGLLSVVNTLKWVSCMVYFFDCKQRKMEKKVDVELGKDLQSDS